MHAWQDLQNSVHGPTYMCSYIIYIYILIYQILMNRNILLLAVAIDMMYWINSILCVIHYFSYMIFCNARTNISKQQTFQNVTVWYFLVLISSHSSMEPLIYSLSTYCILHYSCILSTNLQDIYAHALHKKQINFFQLKKGKREEIEAWIHQQTLHAHHNASSIWKVHFFVHIYTWMRQRCCRK